ncbi:fimbrial protein [Pseudomonas sp. FEN]|uniref:fimbrial protein n=1 Tax=Pseudomonas sp. FEN TaxID=2767468 RepID=UPI0017485EF5|nr:type 1 fimbrial protein [Pseudomonas sp. FEN]
MNLRALPLLLTITASVATSVAHAATTGSLRFTGRVDGGTCNLALSDVSRAIMLPPVKIPDFEGVSYTGMYDFEISANCDADVRNVTFLFAGTAASGNGAIFASTGTASGIGLWLAQRPAGGGTSTIPANGSVAQRSRTVATAGSRAILPLQTAYHKTSGALSQGSLATNVTISITYD